MSALGLAEGAYDIGSKPITAQECVNLYPELVEGRGRSERVLRQTPGLVSFASVGSGPIRGMKFMDGVLYAVSGGLLYSVTAGGTAVSLGSVAGSGRVGMAFNNVFELIITSGGSGWLYDTSAGFRDITDSNFPGGDVVHTLDTYFIVNKPGTQEFWISNSDDGATWTGTDFASKEGATGNLISLIPNHRDLMLFGEKTIEFWRNTGNTDFTFERQEGTFQERGCAAVHSVASLDNTVYFLGDDRIVYRIEGLTPTRISNHGVEEALEQATLAQLAAATAFTYTARGHYFYALTFNNRTWVYDTTFSLQTGKSTWHQRKTGIGAGRWRAENYENAYGKHLVGDVSRGTIWQMDEDTYTDDGDEIERIRTTAPIFSDIRPVSISRLELKLEAGVGNADVDDPQVWLEVSKDGGRTWGYRALRSAGAVGEYGQMAVWRRLGRARDWIFRFKTTDKAKVNWIEAYADVEVGHG